MRILGGDCILWFWFVRIWNHRWKGAELLWGWGRRGHSHHWALCLSAEGQVLSYKPGECERQEGTWWVPAKVARSIPPSVRALPGDQKNKPSLGFRFLKRPGLFLFTVLRGCTALLLKVIYFTELKTLGRQQYMQGGLSRACLQSTYPYSKGLNKCNVQYSCSCQKSKGEK